MHFVRASARHSAQPGQRPDEDLDRKPTRLDPPVDEKHPRRGRVGRLDLAAPGLELRSPAPPGRRALLSCVCKSRLLSGVGTSSHGGIRLGSSADNDSSDSQDSCIGIGIAYGSSSDSRCFEGSGYCHYPWAGAPVPPKYKLPGQIWTRDLMYVHMQ
jgi:hypothetical protein